MPDRAYTRSWRTILRTARGTLYTTVAFAGIAGIIWTPRTVIGTIGEPLTYWWTSLAALGALGALCGVVTDRYRLEWVAIWPAVGGLIAYAFTVWGLVTEGETTRSTQASVITALAVALTCRGLELAAHAAKLRSDHYRNKG